MRSGEERSRNFAKRLRANLTEAETILWSRLRRHPLHKFRRQHPIGPYIADFACIATRVIVEVDGGSHSTESELAHDRRREAFLKRRGWTVVRVWNADVYKSLNEVLDYIEAMLASHGPVPPPPAGAGTSPASGGGKPST